MTETWVIVGGVAALLTIVGIILWATRNDDEAPP